MPPAKWNLAQRRRRYAVRLAKCSGWSVTAFAIAAMMLVLPGCPGMADPCADADCSDGDLCTQDVCSNGVDAEGNELAFPFERLVGEDWTGRVNFKQFQKVDARYQVPEGFRPGEWRIEIIPEGDKIAAYREARAEAVVFAE